MKAAALISALTMSCLIVSCGRSPEAAEDAAAGPAAGGASFADDLAFLKSHVDVHVLESASSGARVAVVPAWQGRVMTSTGGGDDGRSMGWIHRSNVAAGILPADQRKGLARHIHVFGGEERFWLGPEGGQFALYFPPPPADYTFENWKVPALLDTEPFEVVEQGDTWIRLQQDAELANRAGTTFPLRVERAIDLLERDIIRAMTGLELPAEVRAVSYRTTNTLTNRGPEPWTKEGGLISIWLLGMFHHGPQLTMVVPLRDGSGPPVNADYFGELGEDRLRVTGKAVFFKGDGEFRSKIGVPPARSTGVAGAYDPQRGTLTIIRAVPPPAADSLPYVRSQWEDHANPYAGDLINVYNDGPPAPGVAPLGPFYELESSSPALPLEPGASLVHVQETMHFEGDPAALDPIARAVLGVPIEEITNAFPSP